jgi:competence protein ComK
MSKLDYVITYETMMLETADHPEYLTKITDQQKGIVYSKHPAKTLINESALTNNHSIKGHIEIVKNKYPRMKKIPLMINSSYSVIMIPTTSPSSLKCKWLNYIQIDDYDIEDKKRTFIKFKNGEEIVLPVSYYVLDKQMSKATKLIGIYLRQKVDYKVKSEKDKLKMLKEFMADYLKRDNLE